MTRYAQLLSLHVDHGYHLNFDATPHEALDATTRALLARRFDINRIFTIEPTPETHRVLAGHRMLFKPRVDGFVLAIEVDSTGTTPVVLPARYLRLSFALSLKDRRFMNYSSLPTLNGGLYRFSNESANTAAGNFLSRTVADFDSARAYEAGELYFHPSGAGAGLFQAIRDTGPTATATPADWRRIPPNTYDPAQTYSSGTIVLQDDVVYQALVDSPGTDLSNATEWQELTELPNQYVTAQDYLTLYGETVAIDVSSAAIGQASVEILPLGSSTVLARQDFSNTSGNLALLQVALTSLPPGAYHLQVVDASHMVLSQFDQDFYLSSEAQKRGWFGVIDIGLGSGSFALINASNQLLNPACRLSFLNRATRWRYIFPQAQALGSGAQVVAENTESTILVTNDPRPLTIAGSGVALQADSAATPSVSEEVLLPQPEVFSIRYQSSQWYSETHMSNLTI